MTWILPNLAITYQYAIATLPILVYDALVVTNTGNLEGGKMSQATNRYLNMKIELQRVGVTQEQVAKHFGMSTNNLNAKINGRVPFTVPEVIEMRDKFMPDATLDYLLSRA